MAGWEFVTDEEFDTERLDQLVKTANEFHAGSLSVFAYDKESKVMGGTGVAFIDGLVVGVDFGADDEGSWSITFAHKKENNGTG